MAFSSSTQLHRHRLVLEYVKFSLTYKIMQRNKCCSDCDLKTHYWFLTWLGIITIRIGQCRNWRREHWHLEFLNSRKTNPRIFCIYSILIILLLFPENTGNILGASEWNTGYPSTATVYPSYGPLQPPYYKPDPTIHIPAGNNWFFSTYLIYFYDD